MTLIKRNSIYSLLFLFTFILIIPFCLGKSGHITLLTVTDIEEEIGGTADMYLEVKPGNGNIYMDSFPLTKVDTQISTRFANQIACDFLEKDCSQYDFFYTIRANSAIVGGPSAGAAITVLTISVLGDIKLDEKTIMTGTIDSGRLIGPVSGLNAKAKAAQDNGFKTMLIPKWKIKNETINISNLSINIINVTTLEEAMYYFSGINYSSEDTDVNISPKYSERMKIVASKLCERFLQEYESQSNSEIKIKPIDSIILNESGNYTNLTKKIEKTAYEYYQKSENAMNNSMYYSAASFCFSANLKIREDELKKYDNKKLLELYSETEKRIDDFENEIDNMKRESLADLETYMIVKERVSEAKNSLNDINKSNVSSTTLAYSIERFYSAVSWSEFFGIENKKIELNKPLLKESCLKKISEAEERRNYVSLYFPNALENDEMKNAYNAYRSESYELCLFSASKAKAEADIIVSSLFLDKQYLDSLINEKLNATRKIIIKEQKKNIFPILGYSYYEYSQALKEEDPYSSLIYAEYALELSNLDMYFPKKEHLLRIPDVSYFLIFIFGIIIGSAVTLLFLRKKLNLNRKETKKSKIKPKKTPQRGAFPGKRGEHK